MKKRILKIMAVIMAAIFIFGAISVSAAPSNVKANKDYRNLDILNRQGVKVNKPTAQFSANRIVNGEVADMVVSYAGYDYNADFPTLICYVGDTLTFTDMSTENNGGKIVEWDWQRFGVLGDRYEIYKRNIVNEERYELTEPGVSMFFLCVRSDVKVKTGCCDPWSENGNHQTVGKNKWFPKGGYWYFTAVRVVVKPAREALVHVRCWDTETNTIFHEGTVNAGRLLEDEQTIDTTVRITDWEGYEYVGWNVQFMDGRTQYAGFERDVPITLAGWIPEKYLNVEFVPNTKTGVEVRYWDKSNDTLIYNETLTGDAVVGEKESVVSVCIMPPEDYTIDGWNVQLPDGSIQYEGYENPTEVIMNRYVPYKILNVNCYPINKKKVTVNYIDSKTQEIIKTTEIKPDNSDNESVTAEVDLEEMSGYIIEDWKLKTPDGNVEKKGIEEPVPVTLTENQPHKILDVNCVSRAGGDGGKPPYIPPTVTINPSGICDGVIKWTEIDSHEVIDGYTEDGRPLYDWCTHTFEYKAVLGATAQITPDTLKSGYGFGVDVDCTLNTSLVSNDGCGYWGDYRQPTAEVKHPTTATVVVPWDMTNRLGSQGRNVSMVPDGTLRFTLPASPVSQTGAKKIYTPVELAGTKESPQSHSFEIYIGGGGIGTEEFCQKINGTITINGDMYEDDFSGAD